MKLTKTMGLTLTVSVLAAISAMPAVADRWSGDSGRGRYAEGDRARMYGMHGEMGANRWRGDIRFFDTHDRGLWRGGYWHQSSNNGRPGWWWVVGRTWYPYPQPVYPYPDPYQPPTVIMQSMPQASMGMALPSGAQYWYYCEPSGGYYPYVPSCVVNWKMVPSMPPGMGQ